MNVRWLMVLLVVLLVAVAVLLLPREPRPASIPAPIPALPLLPHDGHDAAKRLLTVEAEDLLRLTREIYVAEPEDPEFREALIPALIEIVARGGKPGEFAHSALGRFRTEASRHLPKLLQKAKASGPAARLRLVQALGVIGSVEAVPSLHQSILQETSDIEQA